MSAWRTRSNTSSVTVLRPYLEGDLGPTRSELEGRFAWLIATYDLPRPVLGFHLNGRILDAFYPEHGLIVELDSRAWHADAERFESDRDRDADHLALGIVTVRITWERLTGRPAAEAARLRQILAQRQLRNLG